MDIVVRLRADTYKSVIARLAKQVVAIFELLAGDCRVGRPPSSQ